MVAHMLYMTTAGTRRAWSTHPARQAPCLQPANAPAVIADSSGTSAVKRMPLLVLAYYHFGEAVRAAGSCHTAAEDR
jgi:hypothetical protein